MALKVKRLVSGHQAAAEFREVLEGRFESRVRYEISFEASVRYKIKELRERNGWTKLEFSAISDVNQSTYQQIETWLGLPKNSTISFRKILIGFGISPKDADDLAIAFYPNAHTTELGTLIRAARESSYLSQGEFARQAGISVQHLAEIERKGSQSNHANEDNLRKILDSEIGAKFSDKERERILSLQLVMRKSTEDLMTEQARLKARLDEISKELARREI